MGPPNSENEDEDLFFDALDAFSFFDCITDNQPESSTSQSLNISHLNQSLDIPSPTQSLRRRSRYRAVTSDGANDYSVVQSPTSSNESTGIAKTSFKGQRGSRSHKIPEKDVGVENNELNCRETNCVSDSSFVKEEDSGNSTVTTASDRGPVGDSVDSAAPTGDSTSNFLVFIAELVINAIGFQVNLFITFITLPVTLMYQSFMFIVNPLGTMSRGMMFWMGILHKGCNFISGYISPSLRGWLEENKSIWKVGLKCGWGLLWSIYVGVILLGLLLSSLVSSGFVMKYLVEEPIRTKEVLNFDYTKQTPVAYVPILSCAGVDCGGDCKINVDIGRSISSRVIPKNHRSQVLVSLVLPESGYNRNLGIFQIRVDFLSANGRILASSSHPCMLQFKSEPIRLLLTFLKIAPLVSGYTSEAQSVNVRMGGFHEADIPTACLRVKLEQRAEFQPGAGIPEIYDASIILESELPFIKRIIWFWRKTIFIWLTFTSFMIKFLLTLLCCRPCIFPRGRRRDPSARGRPMQTNLPVRS